jgi:choline dehydrogenase-like flavoprotein
MADYIIVGGGLTGCAIASLLSRSVKKPSVVLVEAGPDPTGKANTDTFLNGLSLLGGELDYAYQSVPVKATFDRIHTLNAGKVLGGGSVLNFGGWLRADSSDYDQWGRLVNDKRWSYEGLKPYLEKTEAKFEVAKISDDIERQYPLREPVRAAWKELGVQDGDSTNGRITGLLEISENATKGGIRQPSQLVYSLEDVDVLTDTLVQCVTFDKKRATGVLLADGRKILAKKEVILCAGAYRTPQLLMLSGIGNPSTLEKFDIPVVHPSTHVGENLFDHFAIYMAFKLQKTAQAHALGSAAWTTPSLFKGLPYDWVVSETVPKELLEKHASDSANLQDRNLYEVLTIYVPPGIPGIPVDGSHIATSTMLLLPQSRGNLSLRSASPTEPPLIQPNYLSSDLDRETLKYAARRTLSALLGTEAMKKFVQEETPPSAPGLEGLQPLATDVSDDILQDRIERTGAQHHHSGGTVAMGTVVDTDGRVLGTEGLRVVDASIIPTPLGGHPQATLYAMAEQLASIILE